MRRTNSFKLTSESFGLPEFLSGGDLSSFTEITLSEICNRRSIENHADRDIAASLQ